MIAGSPEGLTEAALALRAGDPSDGLNLSAAVPEPARLDDPAAREWRQQNWGTPAPPFDVTMWGDPAQHELGHRFRTEVAPPETWLEAVAKRFPDLAFDLVYQADDHGFAGRTA